MRTFYVYILASKAGVLYTGVTNNIKRRVFQHKTAHNPGFSQKYKTHTLVYYETFGDAMTAIKCEKKIKTFSRKKKVALIDSINPKWLDLAEEWFDDALEDSQQPR
jgi:putative endonuclease